jgi:hypothetical protein
VVANLAERRVQCEGTGLRLEETSITVKRDYDSDFGSRYIKRLRAVSDEPSRIMADINLCFLCKCILLIFVKCGNVDAELLDESRRNRHRVSIEFCIRDFLKRVLEFLLLVFDDTEDGNPIEEWVHSASLS